VCCFFREEAIENYNAAIGLDPNSSTLRALPGKAYSISAQSDMDFFDPMRRSA